MRYHYGTDPTDEPRGTSHGIIYICNNPIYERCTLYKIGNKGLGVIQQCCMERSILYTFWDCIQDDRLVDDIYFNPGFERYFRDMAGEADADGCYPTVTARQIMWALRMKPLPKARWETVFDRRFV